MLSQYAILANSFEKLGNANAPITKDDMKIVIVNPNQKDDTPMEIKQTTGASKGAEASPKTLSVSGVAAQDDYDRSMLPEVLDDRYKRC